MKRRKTKSKEDVLKTLKSNGTAMSHDMIETKIEDYNRATIYRILNRFQEDGIVHRIVGIDGKQYFAICTNCEQKNHSHNHLHFQCTNCKRVECLKEEPRIDLPKNYVMHDFNGLISGLCGNCN